MSKSEYDKSLNLIKICMRLTGVWPGDEENIYSSLKFFFCAFILIFFNLLPQFTKLYFVRNDFNDIVEVLTVSLSIMFVIFCKLCSQSYNKRGKYLILNKHSSNFIYLLISICRILL